jgi:Domain of unknown function (DU1801)
MAELKTKKTKESVAAFLAKLDDRSRKDCKTLVALMENATGAKARMWGTSIVGFGDYRYRSAATGREGDWFQMGFSPRKAALTLYLMGGLHEHGDLLKKLGKYKTSQRCLYIKKLDDVDGAVLRKLIGAAARSKKLAEV